MRLRYTRSMEVGDPLIDQQHRQLIQLLNALLGAVEEGAMEAARTAALEFQELALRHLDDEEAIFPQDYDAARHLKGHHAARKLIESLRLAVCDTDDPASTRDEMKRLLPDIVMELFNNDAGLARSLSA